MIPAYLLFIAALLAAQSSLSAQEAAPMAGRVASVECSIIRKNSCNKFSKVVKGRFSYDAAAGAAAYVYDAPFLYRFIVNDTAIVGIDTRRNAGYAARRTTDLEGCDDLFETVHFFGAYLRCVNADRETLTPAGCTESHWYYGRRNRSGTDILARSIETGAVDCIESFDEKGVMFQQLKARFDEGRHNYDFPVRIVVRRKCGGMLTADTVLISAASVNRAVRGDAFTLPAGCELHPMEETRQGLFSTGQN